MWNRALLIATISVGATGLGGCGKHTPDVVVATMPAKAKLYPRASGFRGGSRSSPVRRFDARRLVGQDVGRASKLAAEYGCTIRIVEGDGAAKQFTADLVLSRIDVRVEHGVITRLTEPYR